MKKFFNVLYFIYFLIAAWLSFVPDMKKSYFRKLPRTTEQKKVSVIATLKNEENRIGVLLDSLSKQTYSNLEIVLVDDRSTDSTSSIIEQFAKDRDNVVILHITEVPTGSSGKHYPLSKGFEVSTGDILFFTDSGCSFGPDVIRETASLFSSEDIGGVVLPYFVSRSKNDNLVVKMQYVTEHTLSEAVMGSLISGVCLGGKASGIAYSRKAYKKLGTHMAVKGKLNDDVEFTNRVFYGGYKVIAAADPKMVVTKMPKQTWFELGNQHVRWLKGVFMGGSLHIEIFIAFWLIVNLAFLISIFRHFHAGLLVKLAADYLFVIAVNKTYGPIISAVDEMKILLLLTVYTLIIIFISFIPFKIKWK